MKTTPELDYLFIGAHPDDCEIFAGGMLLKLKKQNRKVGILDLTQGEMGTYGSVEKRSQEIEKANSVMELDFRDKLAISDCGVRDCDDTRAAIASCIRETKAKIVVTFPQLCRHPDHLNTHHVVKAAVFLAGVKKYLSTTTSSAHRPMAMIQWVEFLPLPSLSFVFDITDVFEKKTELVQCYDSQIMKKSDYDKAEKSDTFIGSSAFWDSFEGKAKWFGSQIGVRYGEAYYCETEIQLKDPLKSYSRDYR